MQEIYERPLNYIISFIMFSIALMNLIINYRKYKATKTGEEPGKINYQIVKPRRMNGILCSVLFLTATIIFSMVLLNKQNPRPRIAILLPNGKDLDNAVKEDGERQILGYAKLLMENPGITENYDIRVLNHNMNLETAKKIIVNELQNGTRYFVCTMSAVSAGLSKEFNQLIQEKYKKDNPIIIFTVASTPLIDFNSNNVFRFYIRSKEEGNILAQYGRDSLKLKNAITIYVDDNYGIEAEKEFVNSWNALGGSYSIRIPIPNKIDDGKNQITDDSVYSIIKQNFDNNNNEPDAIFIAHYGSGLDQIISALRKLKLKSIILSTSTLSIETWQRPVKNYLDRINWVTCVPDFNNSDYNCDVVRDFTFYTLNRLIKIIEKCEGDNSRFKSYWEIYKNDSSCMKLNCSSEKNGDAIIYLKAQPHFNLKNEK